MQMCFCVINLVKKQLQNSKEAFFLPYMLLINKSKLGVWKECV